MATSAGWDGTLNAIFDDTDCKLPDSEIGETGRYFDNLPPPPPIILFSPTRGLWKVCCWYRLHGHVSGLEVN